MKFEFKRTTNTLSQCSLIYSSGGYYLTCSTLKYIGFVFATFNDSMDVTPSVISLKQTFELCENQRTDLFSELAGPQKDASVAGTRDSLISDSSSSELSSDEKSHSEDLGGERGVRVERGRRRNTCTLLYQHQTCYIRAYGKEMKRNNDMK